MNQTGFDWNADVNLPVAGCSPAAREASASAAQAIFDRYGERVQKVLTAFRTRGKLTIREASDVCAMRESSICSVFGQLKKAGWIQGTGEFFTYEFKQSKYPRKVRREFQVLTARGIEAASYFRSAT
jgi:hypothetical protein